MHHAAPRFRLNVAVFVVGLLVAVGTFAWAMGLAGVLFEGKTTHVRALIPTSSALGTGSRVTMAGAQVGRVAKVSRRGYATLVDMEITDASVLPVAVDSRVTLRQRTPVGENYMEITPGTSPRALGHDDVLPIRQADEYVDVDELLSVLQGPGRAGARRLVQGMGGALEDRGEQLNRTLGAASQVVRSGGSVFGVLSQDRRQVAQLVQRLGRLSAAIGERSEAVRVTAARGLVALRAVGDRDQALARTLAELPATLTQVRSTSVKLKAASQTAAPVVANLAATVADLRPAIRDLRPAGQQARDAVKQLGLVAGPLRGTLAELRSVSSPLSDALPKLHKAICQAAPVVRYAEPYTNDIVAAIIGLGSASNSYDAVGHLIRLMPIVGENSLAGLPDEVTQAQYTLLRTGLLGKSSPLTWNPYPKAGMIGKESAAGSPAYSGPKALGASGYQYPHVLADC